MFEIREKTSHDDNRRSSSLSDPVQSGLGPTRKKTELGPAEGSPWAANGGTETGLLSMREFFEAGGRSYEAYLEVCKKRRDK